MAYDIRSRFIKTVWYQCLKLLGPDKLVDPRTNQVVSENTNYLKQWNQEITDPDGNPVPWEVSDVNNIQAHYPLNKQDLEVLGNHVVDGLDSRRLQMVQVGQMDWIGIQKAKLIPCIFIVDATGSTEVVDPVQANTQIGEITPMNIRLVTQQPPDSKLTFDSSNPVVIARMRAALDYLLDPFWFRGITERGRKRRGYANPGTTFDCSITESMNWEAQIGNFEITDFRFEITWARAKQLDSGRDNGNTLRSD